MKSSSSSFHPGKTIDSKDYSKKENLVMIRHGEDWYRLMITKQGKLILTKVRAVEYNGLLT